MTIKNGDMPAMPQPNPETYPNPVCVEWAYGLTKREMLVMAAMQGMCANSIPGSHHRPEQLAQEAVRQADAVLKALEANNE